MNFIGWLASGTIVPQGAVCPKSSNQFGFPLLFLLILIPGKHNTTPITGCTGYNPARLTFTTQTTGGLPPYSYQWQLNNQPVPGETLAEFNPAQITIAGTYAYNCAITDAAGTVVFTEPKLITIVPDPKVSISGESIVCMNASLILNASITDGTGKVSFQWQYSPENISFANIPGATEPTYSPPTSVAGTRYYRINLFPSTGSCNNTTSASVAVTVKTQPVTSLIYHL